MKMFNSARRKTTAASSSSSSSSNSRLSSVKKSGVNRPSTAPLTTKLASSRPESSSTHHRVSQASHGSSVSKVAVTQRAKHNGTVTQAVRRPQSAHVPGAAIEQKGGDVTALGELLSSSSDKSRRSDVILRASSSSSSSRSGTDSAEVRSNILNRLSDRPAAVIRQNNDHEASASAAAAAELERRRVQSAAAAAALTSGPSQAALTSSSSGARQQPAAGASTSSQCMPTIASSADRDEVGELGSWSDWPAAPGQRTLDDGDDGGGELNDRPATGDAADDSMCRHYDVIAVELGQHRATNDDVIMKRRPRRKSPDPFCVDDDDDDVTTADDVRAPARSDVTAPPAAEVTADDEDWALLAGKRRHHELDEAMLERLRARWTEVEDQLDRPQTSADNEVNELSQSMSRSSYI